MLRGTTSRLPPFPSSVLVSVTHDYFSVLFCSSLLFFYHSSICLPFFFCFLIFSPFLRFPFQFFPCSSLCLSFSLFLHFSSFLFLLSSFFPIPRLFCLSSIFLSFSSFLLFSFLILRFFYLSHSLPFPYICPSRKFFSSLLFFPLSSSFPIPLLCF